MKKCSRCKDSKVKEKFGNNRRNKDRLSAHCKECEKVKGRMSRRKYRESCKEISDKVVDENIRYMELVQSKHLAGLGYTEERNMFREFAIMFWDQVESRNQQGVV